MYTVYNLRVVQDPPIRIGLHSEHVQIGSVRRFKTCKRVNTYRKPFKDV